MSDPQLAVVIPHYNDLTRLETCLTALVPQLEAAGPAVEAVVADNKSSVDLGPLQAKFPQLRFITEPQKGAAAARNAGVAATTAPGIAFLDSDCVPGPDWVATALRLCGKDHVVGGRIDTFDETPAPRSGAEAFETVFAFHQKVYVEQKGFSVTANLVTTRAVFEATGPMVVGLSEDVDWCQRAAAAGYPPVYADDLAVAHPTRQDWAALAKKWRRMTEEGFQLSGTSAAARAKWLARAGVVLVSAVPHTPKILGASQLSGQDKLSALGTLYRLRATRAAWMVAQALGGGR